MLNVLLNFLGIFSASFALKRGWISIFIDRILEKINFNCVAVAKGFDKAGVNGSSKGAISKEFAKKGKIVLKIQFENTSKSVLRFHEVKIA